MNLAILLALVPALAWGSVGLVNTKMGGSAAQQTLGMTFGALIFGLGTMFLYVMPNHACMLILLTVWNTEQQNIFSFPLQPSIIFIVLTFIWYIL